jgi:hypothetical protein
LRKQTPCKSLIFKAFLVLHAHGTQANLLDMMAGERFATTPALQRLVSRRPLATKSLHELCSQFAAEPIVEEVRQVVVVRGVREPIKIGRTHVAAEAVEHPLQPPLALGEACDIVGGDVSPQFLHDSRLDLVRPLLLEAR